MAEASLRQKELDMARQQRKAAAVDRQQKLAMARQQRKAVAVDRQQKLAMARQQRKAVAMDRQQKLAMARQQRKATGHKPTDTGSKRPRASRAFNSFYTFVLFGGKFLISAHL
jgi:hypothetical protein